MSILFLFSNYTLPEQELYMNHKRISIIVTSLCIASIFAANIGQIKTYAEESINDIKVFEENLNEIMYYINKI